MSYITPQHELKSFDVEDSRLIDLLSEVSLEIGKRLRRKKIDKEYPLINRIADMLLETSRNLRLSNHINILSMYPVLKVFGSIFPIEEEDMLFIAQEYAKEIVNLSENLRLSNKLPRKRVRELRDLCHDLSKTILRYQQSYER